jgi:hypothetical protein
MNDETDKTSPGKLKSGEYICKKTALSPHQPG